MRAMNIRSASRLCFLPCSRRSPARPAAPTPRSNQGEEGYVYHLPLVFGQMEFRQALRGPATTGLSWRLFTENVDMRAKSYKEDFQLLTTTT